MFMRIALSLALMFLPALAAQQLIPQLDKSKPPTDRPKKAPKREKIDPKDYPRYTPENFAEGPAANWRKALKPEVIEGDLKKMKNPRTNANWNGKHTLKYESIVDANKKTVGHGISRATWNSTGKVYAEGNWRNDHYHGVWTFYTEQGVLESIKCYKEGNLDGPYAEFTNGALHRWGTCVGGNFNGEFRQFHNDGWLQYRTQWIVLDDAEMKQVERTYNAKGELTYQWNYVNGKVSGDQFDWVDPSYDENGKVSNAGSAGRYEVEHLDENSKFHGWQSFYHQTEGYRLFDTWYEHGEQTGPFFINDAAGKQVGGGTKTKGVSTGNWWELNDANRTESTLNDAGEYDGPYVTQDAAGKEIVRGQYKSNKKVGTWVHRDATSTRTYNWSQEGAGLHGEFSEVDLEGNVLSRGMYEKGVRTGKWICNDYVFDIRIMVYYVPCPDTNWSASGEYVNDARNGKWTWKRADGTLAAEGEYASGLRGGDWKFYHSDGKTLAGEGRFAFSAPTGRWVYYHENGQKAAEGTVVGGDKTGHWVHYGETGTKESEGEFREGVETGEWKYYYKDGTLRRRGKYLFLDDDLLRQNASVGEWDDFNDQGELTRKSYYADTAPETLRGYAMREATLEAAPEGVVIDPALPNGTFATYQVPAWGGTAVLVSRMVVVNGQPAGKMQQYYPNGKLGAEGLLYGQTREGLWKYWYDSGAQKEEGTFVEGILQGPTRLWRTDGTLSSEGSFEAGKRLGLWTTYYPDGKQPQREATYGAGEQYDGPLTDYYANGQVQQKGNYAAGKQEGEWHSFFESGAKRYVVNYKAGKLEGRYQAWHENGNPEKDYTYVNGQFEGDYQTWHKNGQQSSKGTFKAGMKSGTWQEWYESGKPKLEQTFDEAGNTTSTKAWNEDGTEKN